MVTIATLAEPRSKDGASSRWFEFLRLLRQTVVLFQDLAQFVMRQGNDGAVVDAGHGFGGDHGIDYGLLRRLNGSEEDGIQFLIGQHLQSLDSLRSSGARIGGREGDEDIA